MTVTVVFLPNVRSTSPATFFWHFEGAEAKQGTFV